MFRIQTDGLAESALRLRPAAQEGVCHPQVVVGLGRVGSQAHHPVEGGDRFPGAPQLDQAGADAGQRAGVVGLQRAGVLEQIQGRLPVALAGGSIGLD